MNHSHFPLLTSLPVIGWCGYVTCTLISVCLVWSLQTKFNFASSSLHTQFPKLLVYYKHLIKIKRAAGERCQHTKAAREIRLFTNSQFHREMMSFLDKNSSNSAHFLSCLHPALCLIFTLAFAKPVPARHSRVHTRCISEFWRDLMHLRLRGPDQ